MNKFPTKFFCFVPDRNKGLHKMDTDEWAVMLSNATPDRNWETVDQIPEVEAKSGYSKGGMVVPNKVHRASQGVSRVIGGRVVFRAAGGAIGPFRYFILYNKTNGRLIAYNDFGGEDDIAPGQTLTVGVGSDGWHSST